MMECTLRGPGLLVLMTFAGCHTPTGPTYSVEQVEFPESFHAGEEGAVDNGRWWESFASPVLDGFVDEAVGGNFELAGLAARLEAAWAQARVAGADRLPQVGAGLNWSRSRQNFVGFPIGGGSGVLTSNSSNSNLSLDVSWEADLWGRLAAYEDAAALDALGVEQDLAAAGESIAAQVSKLWFALIEADLQVALARETEASRTRELELIRQRYEGGVGTALDVRLSEASAAGARAERHAQTEARERLSRSLEVLLGRYPAGLVASSAALPVLPELPLAGLPAGLLERRPDLRSAALALEAADRRLFAARKELYPRLSLGGSVGRNSEDLDDLFDSDFDIWSIAAGLTQPIFQGGRLRAAIDASDANTRAVMQEFLSSLQGAYAEVETLLAVEDSLRERESALSEASEASVAALELARARYDAGRSDLLAVLEAERGALIYQSSLLSARRARLDARVDLHLALGGAFEVPETGPAGGEDLGDQESLLTLNP